MADVMLMASPNEGGPIVLIEAWGQHKPFFMRRTGLAAQHPDSVFLIGANDSAEVTAKQIVSVVDKVRLGDEAVLKVIKNGYNTYETHHSEEAIVPKWRSVINNAYLNSLQNEEAGLYYPRLNIRAIHDFQGNPSHIRVSPLGRTRLLHNLNNDYNVLSLAELDITYVLKQMGNAKIGNTSPQSSSSSSSQPAASANAGGQGSPSSSSSSSSPSPTPSDDKQSAINQPVRAVLQVEYETVSDGLVVQKDGTSPYEKVTVGYLDVRVKRKASGANANVATGPNGINQSDELQMSIRLESEPRARVKTLLTPPVGFEYLSIIFRVRGGVTLRILGVSLQNGAGL